MNGRNRSSRAFHFSIVYKAGYSKSPIIRTTTCWCALRQVSKLRECSIGAGKTNVALLAIVHEVKRLLDSTGAISRDELKIIYVAPMKALAQEIVAKFSSRLSRLGLTVRELTGGNGETSRT